MKKRNKSQYKPKNYFALPHAVTTHPDFIKMRWSSKGLLISLGSQYNGFNNGDLCASRSVMRNMGFKSNGVLNDAIKELLKEDWIRETRKGHKCGVCSLYAISWIPLDDNPKLEIRAKDFKPRHLKS